jgi:putative sigma-54 modulation protein
MIEPIQITGIAYEADANVQKYVMKKIGRLDRYLTRHARKSASAEVKLAQVNHDYGNKYEVEIILSVPGKLITAHDSASNILSAIDIVEAKIRTQLHDYKQTALTHVSERRILSQFKRSFKREL